MKKTKINGEENDEDQEEAFREQSSSFLSFPRSLHLLRWLLLSLNRFPLFLFLLFSFSFKSLSIHVILRFLAEKSPGHLWNLLFCTWFFQAKFIGHGKIHQALVKHAVLNPTTWSQIHRLWINPPDTCGTHCFESN